MERSQFQCVPFKQWLPRGTHEGGIRVEARDAEVRNMVSFSRPFSVAAIVLSVAVAHPSAIGSGDGRVFAQAGGSGGNAGGGTGSGTVGSGSSVGTRATPGGIDSGPSTRTPATGPQSRSPAMRPSTVPQVDTGNPSVPSAGNAEPNSPIYRLDTPPGALTPQPDAMNPADASAGDRAPRTDAPPGGSGGSSAGRTGAPEGGDALVPTDPSGNPARFGSGRAADSISDEPNRVTRGGAAGKDLDECMKLWDPGTHMTKERWRTTCERLGR